MSRALHFQHCGCGVKRVVDRSVAGEPYALGICRLCGEAVRMQFWEVRGVYAHMGRHTRSLGFLDAMLHGLQHVHPGRIYTVAAREELLRLSESCWRCFGTGSVDRLADGASSCPYCLGVGRVPVAPLVELQRVHRQWFWRWPEFLRESALYGTTNPEGTPQVGSYGGPAIPFLEDPNRQVVYSPLPYAVAASGEQAWTFLPVPHARRRALTMQVLKAARTWGELRRAVDPVEWHLFEDRLDARQPDDDEAFSGVDFSFDGPPRAESDMGAWFPFPEGEDFGAQRLPEIEYRDAFPESNVGAIVKHLERRGFWVVRDDQLVHAAHTGEIVRDPGVVLRDRPPFREWPSWTLFHVPHASTRIPEEVRSTLCIDDEALRRELDGLTDHHMDTLFVPQDVGDHLIAAPFSRLVVDVERFASDAEEPMAEVGMGVIYTRTHDGRELREPLANAEREALLDAYYWPHHRALAAAVERSLSQHGRALIIDLHSFPNVPLPTERTPVAARPDFCIGTDPFHTPPELVEEIRKRLEGERFRVAIDEPYSGAMVPSPYLWRDERVVSVMIEVNRGKYLEAGGVPTYDADRFGRSVQRCLLGAVRAWDRVGGVEQT